MWQDGEIAVSRGVGPGVKPFVRQQFEAVHGLAQFREQVCRRCIRGTRFHTPLGASETVAQGAVLLGIAQLAEELADLVRLPPGLFDQSPRGSECDPSPIETREQALSRRRVLDELVPRLIDLAQRETSPTRRAHERG